MEKYHFSPSKTKLLESSNIPFVIYQVVDGGVSTILVSRGFLDLVGYEDRNDVVDLLENNLYSTVHPDDADRVERAVTKFMTDGSKLDVVYRLLIRDEYRVIHVFAKHTYPEEGVRLAEAWYVDEGIYVGDELAEDDLLARNFSISLHDISLQRKEDLDHLTGLPNMTYFFELAKVNRDAVLEKGGHCAIGFADLNGMKYYNKKFGFAEGDNLLKDFAELLIKYFKIDKCCRIAQDNFAFFSETDDMEEKLKDLFRDFSASSMGSAISVRVGIYTDTMGIVETGIACDRARFACNSIKHLGKSGFCYFDETMLRYETNRQYIIDNLDKAIRENWIIAYYQPIVRAANGRVCDEEALARWIDPERGMLSPAEFIPILEDAKLIYKVDLHIVDLIIEKMKAQKKAGLYLVPISVNLSRTDFDSCDIVSEICERLDKAGIERNLLTIEITESVVGRDFDFMKSQVERFQGLGFRVWMDDFGSGYSSLDLLQILHFDLIKLDMRFMKQFDNGDKSKVIITELMKMAVGLGIETVTEGVEREDQVEFLREVGCTKLQGFYYCKPIPMDEIFLRNKEGIQIGFENPDETEYYESLGKINLYDLTVTAKDDKDDFNQYFDTLPMVIFELDKEGMSINRCNRSYREFLKRYFGSIPDGLKIKYVEEKRQGLLGFLQAVRDCAGTGERKFINEKIGKDTSIHAFVKWIAKNPVNGVSACMLVVLGINKDPDNMVTYADIANSLSADYIDLFHVNLETEEYTEYMPDPVSKVLSVTKSGVGFFEQCRKDALIHLYPDDSERFASIFTKENVVKELDDHGAFTLTYRLMVDGNPVYVHLKATRKSNDDTHMIMGVNNIDSQKRAQESIERLREEKITYSRIAALTGNYIGIYTVDPVTNQYMEYSSTKEYAGLGLDRFGDDFFEKSRQDIGEVIYPEDKPHFDKIFNKENVLKEIKESGAFILNYRLMIEGKPTYIRLKAAMIEEKDGPQIIVGVSNVDAQMRRDLNRK